MVYNLKERRRANMWDRHIIYTSHISHHISHNISHNISSASRLRFRLSSVSVSSRPIWVIRRPETRCGRINLPKTPLDIRSKSSILSGHVCKSVLGVQNRRFSRKMEKKEEKWRKKRKIIVMGITKPFGAK